MTGVSLSSNIFILEVQAGFGIDERCEILVAGLSSKMAASMEFKEPLQDAYCLQMPGLFGLYKKTPCMIDI